MKLLRGPFFSIIDGVFRALLIYSFLLSGMIIPPAAVQAATPAANPGAGARAATNGVSAAAIVVTNGVATHRFLIYPGTNEAETVTQLQQQGVTKIEKYGSYWLGTGPAAQPQLQSAKRARSAPQIETVDHFNKIELGAASFDVTAGEPALPAHLKQAANQNKNLQIVQFKGPVVPDWLAQLKAIPGVRVIRYIPNNAYLIQIASAARQAVQNLATTNGPVQWIGAYHPYYKMQGDLLAATGVVEINVGILDGTEAEATLTTLGRHALHGMTQRQSATQQWVAQLKVNASDLPSITQLPSVLWVQRYHPVQHLDEMQGLVLANDTGGGSGYPVPLQKYENFLTGLGFGTTATDYPVLDICDTGIDKLSPYCTPPCANYAYPLPYITWHPAFSYPTLSVSPDETTCNYPFGVQFRKVYDFSGADDTVGHGTIVASVACGYDNLPDEPFINCITQGYITNTVNTEVIVIVTNGFTVGFESCVGFLPPPCCSTPDGCTNWNLSVVKVTNVVITTSCITNDASTSSFPPPPWYLSRRDFSGYQLGMGVSPFGRFGASSFTAASGGPEGVVLQNYLNGGARISNNSWHEGLSVGSNDGHYDSLSQSYDSLTRDAVSTGVSNTPGHLPMNQEILFVFAGGNDNGVDAVGGYGDVLITPPATAKNVISVGATDLRAGSGNTFNISTFSSFGPTQDGRFKPDVVAPGEGISGAISQASYVHTDCGACDPNAPNPYACASGFTTKPALQRLYGSLDSAGSYWTDFSGTSFAAPAVAGGAQLLWWWFQNKLPSNGQYVNPLLAYMLPPSPAMMKAYILNSARYLPITNPLTGTQDKLPSIAQGMGMMDLSRMFDLATGGPTRILRDESTPRAIDVPLYYTNAVIQQTYFSAPGQSYEVTGTVASALEPFRVTLAWTDAPGDPLVLKQLVNDLDLQVTISNQAVYAGNDFNTQYAAVNPNPKYDKLNNVESVFLPAGLPAGTPWSILIRAVNIAGNGVLNVGSANDQDFALVIYNAHTGTSDTVPPVATNNTCQAGLSITNFPFTWTNKLTAVNYANIQPSPTAGRGGIDEFFKLAHPSPGTQFNVDTLGSSFDTVVSVWRGSCGALVEENSNNDASNSFQSATSFTANGVDDYYIVAEPHNNGPGGQLVLHVSTSVSPVILTPGSINFPDTISGITSTPQTVTLQNGLTVLLNVLSTTITGANSNEFVILSSTCAGSTVTSNGSCTISVAFAPTSTVAVARSAQLVIYDDATGSPRFVNLTGNALAPAALVQLTPNVVSFGTQAVSVASAPQTVTIKNIGTANLLLSNAVIRLDPANFAIASTTCGGYPATLTPGASCSFNVTFTPGTGGPTNAILSITNSTGVAEANLLGTGCPVISIPTILPPAAAGAPYNQVLVASNGTPSYTYAVTVGTLPAGLTLSGSGVLSGTPSNLVSQTFTVTATDIYGCSGTQTYTLTVGCSTPNLHPGTLPAGLQFAPYSVTFTASGGIAPYNYAVTAGGLPPGLTLALTGQLTGSPTTTNVIPFSVTVTDSNGCASVPITYSLSVVLATPLLSENPAVINFTDQLVGTTGPVQQVTVSNPGNGPLTITDIGFTGGDAGDFLLANTTCLGSAIPAGGNCFINISSAPTNSGLLNATLRILSNAGNQNPATNDIPVHGSGVAPTMGVAPSSIDFGTNRVGFTSIPRSVTVTNTGNGPLTISSVALTGVNPGDFTIVTNLCNGSPILPGQSCRIQLTFRTAASLPRSALLTITGNSTNSPQNVTLSGVGTSQPCPTVAITTTLPTASSSIYYSQSLQATGGVPPYAFAVTDGILPAGLKLAVGGQLTGIPTQIGTNTFTIGAIDSFGCPGSQVYTLAVVCPAWLLTPTSLPVATNGVGYSQALEVSTNGWSVGGTSVFNDNVPVTFAGNASSSLLVTNIGNSISNVTVTLYYTNTTTVSFIPFYGTNNYGSLPSLSLVGPGAVPTTVLLINGGDHDAGYGINCGLPFGFDSGSPNPNPFVFFDPRITTALSVSKTFQPTQSLTNFDGKNGGDVNGLWSLQMSGAAGGQLVCWSLSFSSPVQFNFSVTDPANFPPGLVMSSSGNILGSPTTTGTYTFHVQISDPAGCQQIQQYTINVANGAPAISYSPQLLPTFGDVAIGTTSSVQTITLGSVGNINLTITNITVVGLNPGDVPGDFIVDNATCRNVPFPPGATCPLAVKFKPTASGNRGAYVAVYSTDPVNNPIYMLVKGAGIAPVQTVLPPVVNFGTQTVNVASAPQWVQIYNTGDGPLTITSLTTVCTNGPDFTIVSSNCLGSAIQPGSSCSVGISFKPDAALPRVGTLIITGTGTNGTQQISLQGVGANTAPALGINPLSLIFGDTTLGTTSVVQSVTVTNGGTATLVISSVGFAGGNASEFVVLSSTCVGAGILPGNSCTIQVGFAPTGSAARVSNLQLISNSGTGTNLVRVSGSGVGPFISLSANALDFGTNIVGAVSPVQSVVVSNRGNGLLIINNLILGGLNPGDFSIISSNCVGAGILPGKSCHIDLTFQTSQALPRSATLTVVGNELNAPIVINLTGAGKQFVCPTITVGPATLPNAYSKVNYNQNLTGSGSGGLYTYNLSQGQLPDGITLSAAGVLTGLPRMIGTNTFTITATDANGCSGSRAYTLAVTCPTLTILPSSVAQATMGTAYNQSLSVRLPDGTAVSSTLRFDNLTSINISDAVTQNIGGVYYYYFNAGSQLTFTSTVAVAGVDAAITNLTVSMYLNYHDNSQSPAGSRTGIGELTVKLIGPDNTTVTLSGGNGGSGNNFGVACAPDSSRTVFSDTTTNAIADPSNASPYTGTFHPDVPLNAFVGKTGSAVNGLWTLEVDVAPSFYRADSGTLFCWGLSIAGPQITYAITPGSSLPPGLTLTVGGLLSGTPTTSGSYTSTVVVTDASGCTGSQPLIFDVAPAAPIIGFVPNPLPTFGDVVVGTTSAVQSVTVTNLGNAPLVITNLVLAGANTNDFRLTPVSPCLSQLLAPGEACQINVRFAPTTVGNRSTTVLVFDNATNSPHSFQVTGTGISPAILPVPASLDFGTQTVAMATAPLLIDVFNTGNGPLTITGLSLVGTNSPDFTIVTNSCLGTPLQPGSSCSVGIQFTPGATFTRTGTLVIDSNATNGQQRIALRGVGIIPAGAAIAVATPTAVDFGSQLIGSNSQSKVVYVSNVGNTALTINDVQIGGLNTGDFSILTNSCGALLPGQICQIQLQFNPQVALPRRALLLINSTATNGQQQVVLTGLGLAAKPALCLSTTALDFGIQTNAMAGSSRTIQVTNCGTGELAIIDLILTDPNFVISNTTCVGSAGNILGTGQSCSINLVFSPIGNGLKTGNLQIPTDIGTTNITLKGDSVYTCGTLFFPDLPPATAGEPYGGNQGVSLVFSNSLSASNPPVTTQFTLVDGLLPDGLTMSTAGVITGTPTQPGSNQFTIAAMDNHGCGTNRLFNLNVACGQLRISSTLPSSVPASAGLAYSNRFTASIGTIPLNTTYTFTQNRSMPVPHAYYGTNGFVTAITNSPVTVAGIQGDLAKVTVSVHYMNPDSVDNASLSLIGPDGTTVELTYAHDYWPYHTSYGVGCDSSSIATFDDAAPNSIFDYWNYYGYYGYYSYYGYGYYNYNYQTYTGSFRPTSSLTNFIGKSDNALNGNWQLQINNADYWSAGTLTCWSLQLSAAARITYSATGLPAGLTLSSSGLLSGTPKNATNVTIAITAMSAGSNCSGSTNFVLKVGCPTITVQPVSVALAPLNSFYTTTITATNGTAPYHFDWAFTSPASSLPPGFGLDPQTGVISGTATNTGTYTFTVTATDANGCQGSSTSTLTLACGSGLLLPASIVNSPVVGQAYTRIFSVANGGTGSNTYLLAAGSLPPGLILTNAANGNCALLGKATRVGNYSFQLMALTPGGCLVQRTYSLAVVCAASGIGPDQLPLGQLNVAYPATQLTTLGGAGSSTFTVIDGSLPAGLTVSSTGLLQGTPASGSSVFTVLASDGVCSITKSYTIIISLGAQVMVLGPDTLTEASAGQTVAQSLTASGGTGPILFAVTDGALPDGVILSNTGQLQGAPTVPGTNTFTISASDATGMTGSRQYRLVVRPAATNSNLSNDLGVSIQSAAAGTVGSDLTYAITVTNLGSATATAVTVRNLLPVGATFGSASAGSVADGILTANLGALTPNAGATVTVVVTPSAVGNLDLVANVSATEADANPANNSANVTIPVAAAPALDTVQFSAVSYVVTRTGGAARITVTRTGPATTAATVGYTTRDGSGQAGIDYAAGSGLLIFGAGVTEQSFTVAVLPVKGAKVADKTVLLSLSSLTGVRLGSVPSATVTITSKLVVTDSDGDQVTVKLSGHGSVALTLAAVGRGPIQQIVLTGTDARSQLLVTVKKAGGNGYAEVGSIVADGFLLAINAPTVNLVGAGVSVNGCLGALTIHNLLNGAAVTANCAANQTTKITLHAKDTGTTIATGGHVAYKLMK